MEIYILEEDGQQYPVTVLSTFMDEGVKQAVIAPVDFLKFKRVVEYDLLKKESE